MRDALKFIGGFLVGSLAVVGLIAFTVWGESPATWLPELRFLSGVFVVAAGAVGGVIAVVKL